MIRILTVQTKLPVHDQFLTFQDTCAIVHDPDITSSGYLCSMHDQDLASSVTCFLPPEHDQDLASPGHQCMIRILPVQDTSA